MIIAECHEEYPFKLFYKMKKIYIFGKLLDRRMILLFIYVTNNTEKLDKRPLPAIRLKKVSKLAF